jgi:hypothetical protein
MAQVVFVYTDWVAAYPEFSGVSGGAAELYFSDATLFLSNADNSIVQDIGQRTSLLYMLTAHIAYLRQQAAKGNAGIANPITDAQQGSVKVSAAAPEPGTPAWYQLSTYGQTFWRATVRFRSGFYVAPRLNADQMWARRW